mgnify:CR=1 FL=1
MKLIRNPEVFRLLKILILITAIGTALAILLATRSIQSYKDSLIQSQSAIIGAVLDAYPEAESGILAQIAEIDTAKVRAGQGILAKYGYDNQVLLQHVPHIQEQSWQQTALFVGWTLLICTSIIWPTLFFLRRKYRTIRELRDYARGIAEGRDSLDIRDNGEGDFSMLKNEIYTITSMLREQTERLKHEKSKLSDSLADISHQLKTPMTSLSVMTDLLMDHTDGDMREEFLRRIRSQLDRMEWLVSSLLKLSRLDTGSVRMQRTSVAVDTLVRKALDTLSIPIEIKQHQVLVSDMESIRITVDPEWTVEALINIIKNCIEHTPEQGMIRVEAEENPIFTRITIADNGEGIAPQDLPYLFNRFYKGQNAGDDSVGIGLAMAQAIIKQQNGDIMVKSHKGTGTAFILTFYHKNPLTEK